MRSGSHAVAFYVIEMPDGAAAPSPGLRLPPGVAKLALVAWFASMLAVGATLLGRHLIPLPRPVYSAGLEAAMAGLRGPGGAQSGRWMAVHVLYAECGCSKRIADHLLEAARARPADVDERVLLAGHDAELEERLSARGFPVKAVDPAELGRLYHIESAPLLVLVSPAGAVRYAGGYTSRKQGPAPQDLQILAATRSGETVSPLPAFGCAVSTRLKSSFNPLGLP